MKNKCKTITRKPNILLKISANRLNILLKEKNNYMLFIRGRAENKVPLNSKTTRWTQIHTQYKRRLKNI